MTAPGELSAQDLIARLEQITDLVVGGADLDATLHGIIAVLTDVVGAERCSIMLVTGEGQMRIRAAKGVPQEVIDKAVVTIGTGISGKVAATGEGRLLRDAKRESTSMSGGSYASTSAICVPMRLRGEVIGVINLNDRRRESVAKYTGRGKGWITVDFDEKDLSIARLIANQAAMAIETARAVEAAREHARLHATTQSLEAQVGSLQTQASAFEVISQATDAVVTSGDVKDVLASIVRGTTALLGAARGSIMLVEPGTGHMRMHAAVGVPAEIVARATTVVGVGIAGGVAKSGEAVLLNDAERERAPDAAPSPEPDTRTYRNRSAMCVPLKAKGEILGVLNINDRLDRKEFTATDLFVAKVIANQAAVAIANARLVAQSAEAAATRRALDVARSIQQSFIPSPPDVPGIAIAGRSDACDETGGDYIDFAPNTDRFGRPTGELLIAIGDVSGHGVGSALIMATSRAFLRALLYSTRDLKTLVERLNRLVCNDVRDGQFMTLFTGVIDPAKGTLSYTSAGHDPPVLFRPSTGEMLEFDSTGIPLGVLDDFEYETASVPVFPGDILVLSTDGVWECANAAGEAFGRQRFIASIREHHALPPSEMIDALKRDVMDFCRPVPFHDDFSLVVATLLPIAGSSPAAPAPEPT